MLRQLQQETRHGKGFGFSFEDVTFGGVGDHRGLAVLFDAYLLQADRHPFVDQFPCSRIFQIDISILHVHPPIKILYPQ